MAARVVETFVFAVVILCSVFSCAIAAEQHEVKKEEPRRHDYKLTFKKPYYYNNTIPFFDTFGKTLHAPDFIRLAPDVPNHSGSIWSQLANPHKEWEVEMSFRVTGNYYLGGRGIAFWYTKERAKEGPVYGNGDKWTGLAIMFETVDHSRKRDHPFIMAHINDGNTVYNELADPQERMLAGCYRLFRNAPNPVFAKISYLNNTLKLAIDANDEGVIYHQCFEASNITLPTGYYFGVSALSEGDTPDDHDVLSFSTYELNPPEKQNRPLRPHEAEKSEQMPVEKYEIPEDVKKRIEDIQKVTTQPEETKDREDTRSVDFIKGMQIRILESLDQLHERLHPASVGHDDYYYSGPSKIEVQLSVISQKLDQIMNIISSLESRVSRISTGGSSNDNTIQELRGGLQRIVGKIESLDTRIANQRSFQDSARKRELDQSHTSSTWMHIVYLLFFIVVSVGGYTLYQTKKELNRKKFI